MYSKYFDAIIIEINTFHTTEYQFLPLSATNPCDFAFCFIIFKIGKKRKINSYDFCFRIYNFY